MAIKPMPQAPGEPPRIKRLIEQGLALQDLPFYALAALAGLTALLLLVKPTLGALVLIGLTGAMGLALANRYPIALVGVLWLVAPVNYGISLPFAVVTLSSLVTMGMLVLILLRLAVGDAQVVRRLRLTLPVVIALLISLGIAILTAIPHPNAFNVRVEAFNVIALVYALLFFERRHWRVLLMFFIAGLGLESLLALGLKFGMGMTGASFFDPQGGVRLIQFSEEDLLGYSGGRFRLSGTLGHKNFLAAYLIMMLPLVGLMMLRYLRLRLLLVLMPAVVTLAMTDSMTGWGALLLVGALALLLIKRVDSVAIVLLLLFPIQVLALMRFGETIFLRIDQLLFDEQGWSTVSSRGVLLDTALGLIREYPWLGTGRGNFSTYGHSYYPHAHNLILQKLLEMGIPGGLIFLGTLFTLWALPLATLLRERNRLAQATLYYPMLGVWLGCTGVLAMGMLDYNYQHFSIAPMLMTLLGVLLTEVFRLAEGEGEPAMRLTGSGVCC